MGTLPAHHHPHGRAAPPQINLNESMQVVSRRVVTVAYGEPVHHVMQFDPADPGYLYLMTSHQVRLQPWPAQSQDRPSPLACLAFARAVPPTGIPLVPHPLCLLTFPPHPSTDLTSAGKPCFPRDSIEPQFPQPLMALPC